MTALDTITVYEMADMILKAAKRLPDNKFVKGCLRHAILNGHLSEKQIEVLKHLGEPNGFRDDEDEPVQQIPNICFGPDNQRYSEKDFNGLDDADLYGDNLDDDL